MLEDFKAWVQKKAFDYKRKSMRDELVHHLSALQYEKAVECAKALYTMEKEGLGPADPATVATLASFAAILLDAGKPADAEPYWRELLARKRQTQGVEHPEVGQVLRMLARLMMRLGRPHEAVEFYEQGLALQMKVHGEDHKETDTTRRELEQVAKDLQLNKPSAEAEAKKAKARADALLPPGTVIFAIWIKKPGEATATPMLLGDFEDAFGDKRGITIGSGPDCKVVLEGPGIAPLHLHFEDKGGTRKMHVFERVLIPDDAWEHPIPGVCETIYEAGTLVDDPIAILTLQVGEYQLGYRELREQEAEDLVRYFQAPTAQVPEPPMLVSKARGPFLPRDRENSTQGRPLIGVFVSDGLTARQLTNLGTALSGFREKNPYVVRVEGLQELFSGRYPVFGDVPSWVALNGASEPLIGAAQSCLVMECKSDVALETILADVHGAIPAGSASEVRHLQHGAIRLANFRRRKEVGEAGGRA